MTNEPTVKELVKDNEVKFDFYRAGVMYYTVGAKGHQEKRYRFPVRLDDIGDATLLHTDKAIMFMRYIRKAKESKELQTIEP